MTETKTTIVTTTTVNDDIACGVKIGSIDGVPIGETGNWDPSLATACSLHDAAFNKAALGQIPESALLATDLKTQETFIENESIVGAKGIYAALTFIPYIILGAGVGFFRYLYLGIKGDKKGGSM